MNGIFSKPPHYYHARRRYYRKLREAIVQDDWTPVCTFPISALFSDLQTMPANRDAIVDPVAMVAGGDIKAGQPVYIDRDGEVHAAMKRRIRDMDRNGYFARPADQLRPRLPVAPQWMRREPTIPPAGGVIE